MAFGEILKQTRLERGWTKEYVAERTHMMVKTIDALENEDFRKIPAPIYGRGFIKQYTALLKIDAAPLIEDYMQINSGAASPAKTASHATTAASKRTVTPPAPAEKRAAPTPRQPVNPPIKNIEHSSIPEATTPPASPSPIMEGDLFANLPAPKSEPTAGTSEKHDAEASPSLTPQIPSIIPDTPVHDHPHRAIFSQSFEQEKRERIIVPPRDRSEELKPRQGCDCPIFGPQYPISEPPSPQMGSFVALFKGIGSACSGLITRATRPKVKRLQGDEGRYYTPRMLHQALLIFLILLALTGIVLVFRHVFRLSEAAQSEYGITPQSASGTFELRPVAAPPEPFFE